MTDADLLAGHPVGGKPVNSPIPTRDEAAVRRFLAALIEATAEPLPLFGYSGWTKASDEVRLASLARWALLVLDEQAPTVLAARLAAEIREERRDLREASNAVAEAVDWHREASLPSYAELKRRREVGQLAQRESA